MKSQHFCTEINVKNLKDPSVMVMKTYRTGWIPQYKIKEIINLKIRPNSAKNSNRDRVWCQAIVTEINLIEYKDIPAEGLEEVERYNRTFDSKHRFFEEIFMKLPTGYDYNSTCPHCSKPISLKTGNLNKIPNDRVYKNIHQDPPVKVFCNHYCKTSYLRAKEAD